MYTYVYKSFLLFAGLRVAVGLDADDSHTAEELVSGNTAEQLSKDVRDKVRLLDFLCHPHSYGDGRVEGSATDCSAEQNGECESSADGVCVSGGKDHVNQGKCADELNNKLLHLIVGIHKKIDDADESRQN